MSATSEETFAATIVRSTAMGDVRIRQVEPSDHVGLMMTMASPRSFAGTLQLPFPSREQWRARLGSADPEQFVLVAEIPDPGSALSTSASASTTPFTIVGHAGLSPAGRSLRRRHAMGLGMSVRDEWQGRGIGSALLAALIERADGWMGVLRIELTVFTDNATAIALYRRHGFEVEGTHRAYALRDGRYVDALAMARLHPRPPALPSHEGTA